MRKASVNTETIQMEVQGKKNGAKFFKRMTENFPDLMKTTNFPTKSEDKQKINSLKNVTVKLLKTKK